MFFTLCSRYLAKFSGLQACVRKCRKCLGVVSHVSYHPFCASVVSKVLHTIPDEETFLILPIYRIHLTSVPPPSLRPSDDEWVRYMRELGTPSATFSVTLGKAWRRSATEVTSPAQNIGGVNWVVRVASVIAWKDPIEVRAVERKAIHSKMKHSLKGPGRLFKLVKNPSCVP